MASPQSILDINSLRFLAISTRQELAQWLGVSDIQLRYIAYAMPLEKKYTVFKIKKKNGGDREISAPTEVLKRIQRRISEAVDALRRRSLISNGFEKGRSICEHAGPHRRKNIVITADIKDFFPSVNFGRVRGVFLSAPFCFNEKVATLLAQLCTDGKALPQGAPSSPSIANMVCVRLDRMLMDLAVRSKCSVTRYADDICFSTGSQSVPSFIAHRVGEQLVPAAALISILRENGFDINPQKFRVTTGKDALVTGLKFRGGIGLPRKWRRRLRAELHVCRKYGTSAADIIAGWEGADQPKAIDAQGRISTVLGKVGFMHWLDKKFKSNNALKIARSYPQLRGMFTSVIPHDDVDVLVEGVTDKILLAAALDSLQKKGFFSGLRLNFLETAMKGGPDLEKTVRLIASTGARRNLTVALFDSDDGDVLAKVGLNPGAGVFYRALSDGVYVVALKPAPWLEIDSFCIENLLRTDTFSVQDTVGRRLFLAAEFSESGLHHSKLVFRSRPNKKSIIVDSDVYSVESGDSVALAKHSFAQMVAEGASSNEDFYGFHDTFGVIKELAYEYHLSVSR